MFSENKFLFNQLIYAILSISLFLFLNSCSNEVGPTVVDENKLESVTPEKAGYSSFLLQSARQYASQNGFAAVMALYDGKVFFSYGEITKNYLCHSIRKTFLSSLYGIYISQGQINIDKTLAELGIDDLPPSLTAEEKQAAIRDLLKSRSGVYHKAAYETEEMKTYKPQRGSHPPGTFFYYNNWDFNVLGKIFEQETGTKIFEEFKRKIADPIGMEDFSPENCSYIYEDSLSIYPAYSFRMSARDMARFGVLYQRNGNWNGNQIIPPAWITESTNTYSILDSTAGVGYGYMWCTIIEGSNIEQLIGVPGFYHDGVGVHLLVVFPALKLVIVERYDTDGAYTDPGDAGMQLGLMIVKSKIP